MDVLAVQFHVAGIPENLRITMDDIAPPHLRSLVDRLAASQVDGVALWQFFRLWRMWQAGKRRWVEPVAAFSSTKLGGTLRQVGRAGTSKLQCPPSPACLGGPLGSQPGGRGRLMAVLQTLEDVASWEEAMGGACRSLLIHQAGRYPASGDVVLVHCIAGKHRAAVAGVMILAIFCKLSVTDAIKEVLRHRPVRIDQAFEDRAFAQWTHDMVNTTRLSQPWPRCTGWITTERSHCHVQTVPGITLCCHRQGQASYERLRNPLVTTDRFEAAAWGRVFCPGCKARCPASFLLDL
eukprot:Skav228695  [mRNA]  locus=scaffold2247:527755:531097:- [translate_table: standard]